MIMDICKKFKTSLNDLEYALKFKDKALEDSFYFAGIAKSFEVCFEYSWKYFRYLIINDGLEAKSPREAIKVAASLGHISNVETWLGYLEDRNLAVHDYVGMSRIDYLKTIVNFYHDAKGLV